MCDESGTYKLPYQSSQIWSNCLHSVFEVVIKLCPVLCYFNNLEDTESEEKEVKRMMMLLQRRHLSDNMQNSTFFKVFSSY